MSKIKVVHICDKFGVRGSTTHGVSRFFAYLMPRHDHERFDVSLIALKHPDTSTRALEAEGIAMQYMGKDRLSASILGGFIDLIRRERPHVLHLHGWIAANFGRLAGWMTGVPTIMHEHGVDPRFPLPQRMADRVLSPVTHTAVAVSKSVREFLIRNRSVSPDKIRLIYLGVPLERFSEPPSEVVARTRQELGIPADSFVVGTVGRVDVQKGMTYFVKAAARVLRSVPNVRFLVVGDGPKREELEREAEALGVAARMSFLGHRGDVPVVQSLMDVQVFPSLWEGTPLTIFEAMAMGRAIVSTGVDGLGEVLTDEESALLVDPADPDQLADGMLRLLQDGELAHRLRSGAKLQSAKFDIGQTGRHLESLYEELYAGTKYRR
jgi:glycosyltransferase involved in cell wall biosynthesis